MTLAARASAAQTITLASLAASSGLTAGRCSTAYDNSTNLDEFVKVMGAIFSGTTPTVGAIEVWAFHERADGTWPALFTAAYTGTDGAFTAQSRTILQQGAALVAAMVNDTTTDREYPILPVDLVALLGGPVRKCAFFVTHSTVAALKSASHDISVKANYFA